ncbi:MAG: hypothetical protein OSJ70_05265 [Bacilli bacterium]|nr:hypothetical protein [Bacilli bacterium]
MFDLKDLLEVLESILSEDLSKPFVFGHGIITEQQIAFDKEALENNKARIASLLKYLGIAGLSSVTLERLTKLKNGDTWNELQTKEEFEALEYLLACSDACGFIVNNILTSQKNCFELGSISSILTSDFGERFYNGITGEWLKTLREEVIGKMHFSVNGEKINEYATLENSSANKSLAKTIEQAQI